jgi:hypothetical protein
MVVAAPRPHYDALAMGVRIVVYATALELTGRPPLRSTVQSFITVLSLKLHSLIVVAAQGLLRNARAMASDARLHHRAGAEWQAALRPTVRSRTVLA